MKKNWGKKIDFLLSLVIIGILLPLFITIICQRMQLEEVIYGELGASAGGGQTGTEALYLGEDGEDSTQDEIDTDAMEERVVGIVAKEISAEANRQAILAQCVIARTNLYDAREKHTAEPEGLSVKEMQELWGDYFEEYYGEIKECVELTENQVLIWNDDFAYAAYHAISAGRTRDVTEMYEGANMPYLTEILCQQDTTAKGYLAVSFWTKEEFLEECHSLFPESAVETFSDIEIVSRDETGYVQEIKVGSETYLGEEFRSRWGLNSACFTLTEVDGQIRIVTKGLGHGFGLSQNTANHMAGEGQNYEKILDYFYPGTELKEISDLK